MFYGRMMTRQHLIGNARIALTPLFAAYAEWRDRGIEWREAMAREVRGSSFMDALNDQMQHVGMFAIAACISLLADNIARIYAHTKLGHGGQRTTYGSELKPEITFGRVLWAAGNAARHYEGARLYPGTEAVLDAFNITARDEQAAFLLLEAAGIKTEDDLLREVNLLCDGIDQAAQAAKAAQPPGP
jgi:hypothetical protein